MNGTEGTLSSDLECEVCDNKRKKLYPLATDSLIPVQTCVATLLPAVIQYGQGRMLYSKVDRVKLHPLSV